jgi:hypothetical protein
MRIQSSSQEVFRRSWLILAPEIGLALAVSSTVLGCYHRAGLRREWAGLGLAVLPIGWQHARSGGSSVRGQQRRMVALS